MARIRRLQVFTRLRPQTIEALDVIAARLGMKRSAAIRHLLGQADSTLKEDS